MWLYACLLWFTLNKVKLNDITDVDPFIHLLPFHSYIDSPAIYPEVTEFPLGRQISNNLNIDPFKYILEPN